MTAHKSWLPCLAAYFSEDNLSRVHCRMTFSCFSTWYQEMCLEQSIYMYILQVLVYFCWVRIWCWGHHQDMSFKRSFAQKHNFVNIYPETYANKQPIAWHQRDWNEMDCSKNLSHHSSQKKVCCMEILNMTSNLLASWRISCATCRANLRKTRKPHLIHSVSEQLTVWRLYFAGRLRGVTNCCFLVLKKILQTSYKSTGIQ